MRGKNVKKQMALNEIENFDNVNICTIVVKPKEYFEKFKNRSIKKNIKA